MTFADRTLRESTVALIWPCRALLGEGPIWLPASEELWFVDIKRGHIHRFSPESGERYVFDVGGSPSFIVPTDDGALLVGSGRALLRVENGLVTDTVATIGMPANNRTNDATVDPNGILWFGTMDDREAIATGRVYRFDGALAEAGGACTITNGPAISPDGRWLYHVDTLAGVIWRFGIDNHTTHLIDGSVFATIDPIDGNPDGVTVDLEGCVWVGLWGGWCVRRYAPDGALLGSIALPCANVTKVAFGGPDLRTAYVTTARIGLNEEDLAKQPEAGGLFSFRSPVPGQPVTPLHLGKSEAARAVLRTEARAQ